MPRGGSKKGEHRGNAKKRVHETPGEAMLDELRGPQPKRYSAKVNKVNRTEQRVMVALTIHGHTGDIGDMTPREVMLNNMHYFMQGAFDWQDHLMKVVERPVTIESAREIERAQTQIERYRNLASEDAYKVAPYIHPRLAALAVAGGSADSAPDIVQALLDDIDQRQRHPKVIEHQDQDSAKDGENG